MQAWFEARGRGDIAALDDALESASELLHEAIPDDEIVDAERLEHTDLGLTGEQRDDQRVTQRDVRPASRTLERESHRGDLRDRPVERSQRRDLRAVHPAAIRQ